MTTPFYWFAISIVAATAVVAPDAAAQQPAAAGPARPNLRVLQALPEAQLFPLMNLVADSLGVGCDYCHVRESPDLTKTPANTGGWVWDRNDKPQKRAALEMMRMVVDLNNSRFQGESRITCYTCHRGSPHPDRLPPLPPARTDAFGEPARLPLPSADRVWSDYVNAVGPADRTARFATAIIRGWDDRSEGRFGQFEIAVSGPDRYRITLTTPDGTTRQGLDGEVAWVSSGDRVLRLSASDVARMRRIAIRYRPLKTERPSNLQVIGVERFADRDAYVATGRIDAVTTRTLYFDVVTRLLRREITTTETLLLPLQEQVDYDDYRDVNGVQLPFRMRTSDGAPYSTATKTFIEFRPDAVVDNTLFRPPAAAR